MDRTYDVLIIGAGVIGCSAARELSRYCLSLCVLEKGPDICMETSNRNSAVLHAGYNNTPGSAMARFCVEGNRSFDRTAEELDIPYRRTGKLVVGFTEDDRKALGRLKEQGEKNGIQGMKLAGRDFIRQKAPLIRGEFALWSPTTAILNPFEFTFGMAENAAETVWNFSAEGKSPASAWKRTGSTLSLPETACSAAAGSSTARDWVLTKSLPCWE